MGLFEPVALLLEWCQQCFLHCRKSNGRRGMQDKTASWIILYYFRNISFLPRSMLYRASC